MNKIAAGDIWAFENLELWIVFVYILCQSRSLRHNYFKFFGVVLYCSDELLNVAIISYDWYLQLSW